MTERFNQDESVELTPEAEFAPFMIDTRSFAERSKEEQDAIDMLLKGDAPELFSDSEPKISSEREERAPTPEETIMAEHIAGLQEEADDIIAHTPEADQPRVKEKINTVMRALIVGGIGLFGAANHASAFDLGDVLGSGVGGILQETREVRQQERQAEFNAKSQLRQAQISYEQNVAYIRGQIATLDNPKLQDIAQRQANAYWNAVYTQRMAWAKTPEQQEQVKAQVDAERAQALAGQEMQKEQQKLSLESQIIQADMNFENQKAQIEVWKNAEIERIKEQAKYNRQQRRY